MSAQHTSSWARFSNDDRLRYGTIVVNALRRGPRSRPALHAELREEMTPQTVDIVVLGLIELGYLEARVGEERRRQVPVVHLARDPFADSP